jgi:hypothetical protein
MKTVSAFETTDGRLFNSERAAKLHQTFLNEQVSIEEFLNDKEFPYKSVPQRAIARNTITMWELWRGKK